MQSIIKEDLGFLGNVLNNPTNNNIQQHQSSSEFAHNRQGIQLFNYNFASWQQSIIHALKLNNSVYVVASPGAGKTAPVLYAWAENILKVNPSMLNKYKSGNQPNKNFFDLINSVKKILNESNKIPKVLYAVPTRTLCDQVYADICELLYQILFKSIEIVQSYSNSNIMQYIQHNFKINLHNEILQRQNLMNQYNNLKNMFDRSHDQTIEKNMLIVTRNINNIDSFINSKIAKQVKWYVQNKLVQRSTKIYTPSLDSALFIISVHRSAYSKVFKKVGKQIKTIIVDEAHTLQYIPDALDKDKQAVKENAKVLYNILKHRQPNTNVIFLSGTINPTSATNLINYLNTCFNLKIKQLNSSEGNASKISIIPDDSINDHKTLINLLINPKDNSNLIILFNKKLIKSLIEQAINKSKNITYTSKDIDSGVVSPSSFQQLPTANYQRNSKNEPNQNINFNSKELLKQANKMPGAAEIENPLLRMAVLHGFGYIFRPDTKDMSNSELKTAMKDQQIVIDLFSSGKIKTILATDAVGIGLNIKVKNLYIPTISKYNGVDFQKLGIADASQLYNRVGRRDFAVSTIYTPSQNIEDILNAISVGNTGFEQRDVVNMKKGICSYSSFYIYYKNITQKYSKVSDNYII